MANSHMQTNKCLGIFMHKPVKMSKRINKICFNFHSLFFMISLIIIIGAYSDLNIYLTQRFVCILNSFNYS